MFKLNNTNIYAMFWLLLQNVLALKFLSTQMVKVQYYKELFIYHSMLAKPLSCSFFHNNNKY